jgi:uncharacterized protein YegP (UPF0339 family)
MAGKYALKTTSDDQYMVNLQAGNNEIILTSERYTTKSAAENGIDSVRANSPVDDRYERKTSSAAQPYFNLKASNGQVIGKSEMYSSSQARDNGIESVKKNGPAAPIDDQT